MPCRFVRRHPRAVDRCLHWAVRARLVLERWRHVGGVHALPGGLFWQYQRPQQQHLYRALPRWFVLHRRCHLSIVHALSCWRVWHRRLDHRSMLWAVSRGLLFHRRRFDSDLHALPCGPVRQHSRPSDCRVHQPVPPGLVLHRWCVFSFLHAVPCGHLGGLPGADIPDVHIHVPLGHLFVCCGCHLQL